jgi:hypothetical protein
MEAQDHAVRHFQLMVELADDLRTLPAQILDHRYEYSAFGSWWTTLRRHGTTFRIIFDGKEQQLRLDRATASGNADDWEEIFSCSTSDHDGGRSVLEVVTRLKAV